MTELPSKKMVGLYKINSNHSKDGNGVSVYNALNTQDNSVWSLKRVAVSQCFQTENQRKSQKDSTKSQDKKVLANQINILKKLKGNRFLKCYHILKTKNSYYYVYDPYPQLSLRELLQFIIGIKISNESRQNIKKIFNKGGLLSQIQICDFQKISIMMQLIGILEILNKFGIVHNNFTDSNIYLREGNNTVDDQDIRVVIGGFYQSQESVSSKLSARDMKSFGLIIKGLNVYSQENKLKSLRAKRFYQFVESVIIVDDLRDLSISSLRQQLQKLTTCQFSSVRVIHGNQSDSQRLFQDKSNPSQTAYSENLSCQIDPYQQLGSTIQFQQIHLKNMSEKLILRKFSQSPNKNTFYHNNTKQNPQINEEYDENKISKQSQQYLIESNGAIKIAFKVCIFAIANNQRQLANYFVCLVQNMVGTLKTKIQESQFWQKRISSFQKNIMELKKIEPSEKQSQENIFFSQQGPKNMKNKIGGASLVRFTKNVLKCFNQYKETKLLTNACLLLEFFKTFDQVQSLRMKRKNLQKVIKLKSRIDSMNLQQLKIMLQNQDGSELVSTKNCRESLIRPDKFTMS